MTCGECGAAAPVGASSCEDCGALIVGSRATGAPARGGVSRTTVVVVVAAGMTALAIIIGLIVFIRALAT